VYFQPNDDLTTGFEVIIHHLWLLTLNDKLFLAPLENPQRILDVGTGTGLWAVDVADYFPSAEVYGTDLSPTQSTAAPPNLHFEVDDCESEWTFPEASFDYVHIRGLYGAISDWENLYHQAYKHIRPGGYIEHLDFEMSAYCLDSEDANAPRTDAYKILEDNLREAGKLLNKDFDTTDRMTERLSKAGFTDITEKNYTWPIGSWPQDQRLKEIGRWNVRAWEEGSEGLILAMFTRTLGWSYEQVQEFVSRLKGAVRDRRLHYYHSA
jgi:ubiquinone/menaquinone biosynthesis C-methylase UbiE